jgi:hypothetical protein
MGAGNLWENSAVNKGDVEEKIKTINEFTKKDIIMEFIGLYLEFSLRDENKHKKKIIKVKINNYDFKLQKIETDKRKVYLTIEEFYNYYNSFMNSLSLLFEQKLERRLSSSMTEKDISTMGLDDSSFCPICVEKRVDISLPCSHFFCEECIKDWLIKSETCPLCRLKLQYNQNNEAPAGVKNSRRWSILINDENTKQELKKDSIDALLKLTKDYFNS